MTGAAGIGRLVAFTLQSTVVLALAFGVTRSLRGRSAALRHAIWTSAVVCLLLLPVLGPVVPDVSLPVWPPEPAAGGAAGGALGERVASPAGREGREVGEAARPRSEDGAGRTERGAVTAPVGAAGSGGVSESDDGARGAGLRRVVLLGWTSGGLAVLVLLAAEGWWMVRLRRRGRRLQPGEIDPPVHEAAARLGLAREPPVHVCPDLHEPVAWGILRPRILLPAGFPGWPRRRREAVLLHELAHVRRRDVAWQAAATVLCALQWFHPLAWIAAHRLREERERACDDEVLGAGAAPADYASELLMLAADTRNRARVPRVATSMAGVGGLPGRIEAVLETDRPRRRATGRLACGVGALGLTVALPLASVVSEDGGAVGPPPVSGAADPKVAAFGGPDGAAGDPAPTASPDPDRSGSPRQETPVCWRQGRGHRSEVRLREEEGRYRVRRETEGCTGILLVEGGLRFSADYDRIVGMSEGALLRIEERRDDGHRRLVAAGGDDDRPRWTWRVDGRERPFDGEARTWLRRRIPVLLRFTGLQAEERSAWLYRRGGLRGLLEELPRLRAHAIRRRYLTAHVRSERLVEDELTAVLEAGAGSLGSDREMGRFLVAVAEARPGALRRVPAADAFWRAARSVGSDGEHAAMLLAAVEAVGDEADFVSRAAESVRLSMGSDGEAAEALLQLAVRFPDLEARRPGPFWSAVATIGSDGEHRRLLERTAAILGPEPERLVRLLGSAAEGIGSDADMALFLVHLARSYPAALDTDPVRTALREAAATVGSDAERRRVDAVLGGPPGR